MEVKSIFLNFQEQNGRRESLLLGIAAAFVFLNAFLLSLAVEGFVSWTHLWGPLLWLCAMGAALMLLQRFQPHHDPFLLPLLALLTGWGIVLLDRLAPNFLNRQVVWLLLGTAVFLLIAILP
ncbi:MAG: hypothetical protein KC421_20910, partial [Anaerolineales bacterium]|nr:hypothetical protein [Anaerolineales bacterium]